MKNIDILEKQLAIDYGCTVEEIHSKDNILKPMSFNEKARPVTDDDCMLRILVYNEKLVIMADGKIMDWCRDVLMKGAPMWYTEPDNLIRINDKLKEYGHCLADVHHYYIPDGITPIDERFETKYYEGDAIKQFENDDRFGEAVLFDEDTPDMIAVCAMEGDNILGMAGATADSEDMWQVGVNVTDEGAGKMVGTYVITQLKNKVLSMGKLPFYGTVESHIKSQRVAIRSGFMPVFLEMFSDKE